MHACSDHLYSIDVSLPVQLLVFPDLTSTHL